MKRVLLAIGIIALLGVATSCNKEKVCKCTYTIEVMGVSNTTDLGEYTIEEGSCSDLEQAGNFNAQLGGIANAAIHCEKK